MTAPLVLMVSPTAAPHLAVALEFHLRRCREQAVPVPQEVRDLKEWASVVHRGLSSPPALPPGDDAAVSVLLLTLPDVAVELGCSLSKVKRLTASGTLPTVAFGGVRRVRRVDLETYVDGLGGGMHLEAKEGA